MARPSLIGLTGGVAAGKSVALDIFRELGAETLSTDAVTHELLGTPEVRDALVERWGEDVAPGGEVARERVGEIVFGDAAELRWLEGLLHPLVGERVSEWHAGLAEQTRLAVVEVPLLFEGGMADRFDHTVCVVAGDELRRERAEARGTDQLEGRDGRQLSQAEKAERAAHVIPNEGDVAELRARIRELLGELEDPAG